MNLFYHSTLAGFIGAALIDVITYIFRFFGVQTTAPWEIAANIFLNRNYIYTTSGVILGLVGTVALSIGVALMISYILKTTGYNMAWLKGLICANAFGFVTIGLFMRLLNIWPQIRNEPATLYTALIGLSLLGIIQAQLLKNWQRKLALETRKHGE